MRAAPVNPGAIVDPAEVRRLVPQVISVLVRRGADFATAEDAVQEALVKALDVWPRTPPSEPLGWLITVSWRSFLDMARAATARRGREERVEAEPVGGPVDDRDESLWLYFLCAHPDLTPSSAVALTLRRLAEQVSDLAPTRSDPDSSLEMARILGELAQTLR